LLFAKLTERNPEAKEAPRRYAEPLGLIGLPVERDG